ncbi:unnamed protein product [Amoebophrya sp. A25]|nr:unnamed protein product [Amoebophrya sp. A25]|eukprot:GSA25T00004812001.1
MARFSDVGARCAFPGCGMHDMLPFHCDRCGLPFCLEHRRESDHNCTAPSPSRRVIVCPICRLTVECLPGEDVNETWLRHANSGKCVRKVVTVTENNCSSPDHPKVKRCAAPGCNKKLNAVTSHHCPKCLHTVCTAHRFEDDHDCKNYRRARTAQRDRAKPPQQVPVTRNTAPPAFACCASPRCGKAPTGGSTTTTNTTGGGRAGVPKAGHQPRGVPFTPAPRVAAAGGGGSTSSSSSRRNSTTSTASSAIPSTTFSNQQYFQQEEQEENKIFYDQDQPLFNGPSSSSSSRPALASQGDRQELSGGKERSYRANGNPLGSVLRRKDKPTINCAACSLTNPKEAPVCEACGTKLHKSKEKCAIM